MVTEQHGVGAEQRAEARRIGPVTRAGREVVFEHGAHRVDREDIVSPARTSGTESVERK